MIEKCEICGGTVAKEIIDYFGRVVICDKTECMLEAVKNAKARFKEKQKEQGARLGIKDFDENVKDTQKGYPVPKNANIEIKSTKED